MRKEARIYKGKKKQPLLPMFSSKSFTISSLTFRSLTHLEIVFVYSIWECSNLTLLCVAVQFSQHHLLKRLFFFSFVYSCLLSHRLGDQRCFIVLNLTFIIPVNIFLFLRLCRGFPGNPVDKTSPSDARDVGYIPGGGVKSPHSK